MPSPEAPVPSPIRAFAAGRPVRLIWKNRLGGLTGLVSDHVGDVVVKWQPSNEESSLSAEAMRLRWLHGRYPSPELVEHRVLAGAELLVTKALPALSAVDPVWQLRPVEATRAIASGLKYLHSLDPEQCPFDWMAEGRIENALARGRSISSDLRTPPTVERLVVCHGDACAPNTLVGPDGIFAAMVDVGALGIGDRWADLAVATMSLKWNYAGDLEPIFWEAYGVAPDNDRIAYYRELWDAT